MVISTFILNTTKNYFDSFIPINFLEKKNTFKKHFQWESDSVNSIFVIFTNEVKLFYILKPECAFNPVARETVVSSVQPYLDHEEIVPRQEKQDGSRPKEFPLKSAVTRPLRSCPSALHSITHSSDWTTEDTHWLCASAQLSHFMISTDALGW